MSGSFVIAGQGLARLEKVGNDSYINQLSLEAKQVKSHEESDMVHAVQSHRGDHWSPYHSARFAPFFFVAISA